MLNSGYAGPVVLQVENGSPRNFQDNFDVNVQGIYLVAHFFIPILRESGGAKTSYVVGVGNPDY